MKLKNKISGEIKEFSLFDGNELQGGVTLESLTKEWEDYEEPIGYWYICTTRNYEITRVVIDDGTDFDILQKDKEMGNYFKTPEEAELAVRKLKAWKRLKDKGFKIKGWKFTPDMKQIEGNYVKIEAEVPQILINEKDLDLLFGGEE